MRCPLYPKYSHPLQENLLDSTYLQAMMDTQRFTRAAVSLILLQDRNVVLQGGDSGHHQRGVRVCGDVCGVHVCSMQRSESQVGDCQIGHMQQMLSKYSGKRVQAPACQPGDESVII